VLRDRDDGAARLAELFELLVDHRAAGSMLAGRIAQSDDLAASVWLVEPVAPATSAVETIAARREPVGPVLTAPTPTLA
jgi:hypothetical protein